MGTPSEVEGRVACIRHALGLGIIPTSVDGGPDIWDLISVARYLDTGRTPAEDRESPHPPPAVLPDDPYPYASGDEMVIGPGTFKSADGTVISHQGANYYLPNPPEPVKPEEG